MPLSGVAWAVWCDRAGFGARKAGRHGVAGEGGESAEEGGAAVYRLPLGRPLRCRLGPGARRARCGRPAGRSPGLGTFSLLVVEQQGLQSLAQVPFDVVGAQAQEDVGAAPGLGAVVDGADLQVHALQAAVGPFHRAQPLGGAPRAGPVECALRQAGADHGETVEPGLGGDGGVVSLGGENPVSVDGPRDVLGHLVRADDLAAPLPALPGPLEPARLAPWRCGNRCEQGLGGLKQCLALAGAGLGPQRGAACPEALAPGYVARVIRARSVASKRDLSTAPAATRARMAGPLTALIQSSPAGAPSSRIRASVNSPRSPTRPPFARRHRSRRGAPGEDRGAGSAVLPGNTCPDTGHPSRAHPRPHSLCSVPFLPARA